MYDLYRQRSPRWQAFLLIACGLLAPSAFAETPCEPAAGLSFICGPRNAEDLVALPDIGVVIASGMANPGSAGRLYTIDTIVGTAVELFPGDSPQLALDRAAFPDCPGPLDLGNFSAHGLALQLGADGVHRLFVTSHGAREAVEVFEVRTTEDAPQLRWQGCIPIPAHNDINSVAVARDGSLFITRISGTGPKAGGDIFAGEISGFLYRWRPGHGLTEIANTAMSGPNGIVTSNDDSQVYVGAWGGNELVRFAVAPDGSLRRDRSLATGFRVDNLRWTPQGTLLIAGHRLTAGQDCGEPLCIAAWDVAEVDAELTTLRSLGSYPAMPGFLGATAALRVGDTLWLGTFHGDRIAHRPFPEAEPATDEAAAQ